MRLLTGASSGDAPPQTKRPCREALHDVRVVAEHDAGGRADSGVQFAVPLPAGPWGEREGVASFRKKFASRTHTQIHLSQNTLAKWLVWARSET